MSNPGNFNREVEAGPSLVFSTAEQARDFLYRNELARSLLEQLKTHDSDSWDHSIEVALLASRIGQQLGFSPTEQATLHDSAGLHDVGKLGVPEAILSKPARPSPEELLVLEQHPQIGYDLLKDFPDPIVRFVALDHHRQKVERVEPNGRVTHNYPGGILDTDIEHIAQLNKELTPDQLAIFKKVLASVVAADMVHARLGTRKYQKALTPSSEHPAVTRAAHKQGTWEDYMPPKIYLAAAQRSAQELWPVPKLPRRSPTKRSPSAPPLPK